MDVREKLVELIVKASHECDDFYDLWDMRQVADGIADYLIANGVTVQEWISVKDRFPDPFEVVLVYDDTDKCVEEAYMTRHNEWVGIKIKNHVTHWLPLPQPPKGE